MVNKVFFMKEAIAEAEIAYSKREVPIGAVVLVDGEIVGRGHNLIETYSPISHAEINAITDAEKNIGDIRLKNAEIFITCEPCIMCSGAIILSRISKVFFGVKNDKFGGIVSVDNIFDREALNHKVYYEGGILQDEISDMMKKFFREIREVKSNKL